ncbi:MAG TPA: caspase family protein, partial [Kofleriaceae bacterium]|nr:caspase family protein [Kofleriaceae bacterium]
MHDARRPLAVIIGITEYMVPRLRLVSPVHDAEALAACLETHHGYEVRVVRDDQATKAGLQHLLEVELPGLLDETRPVLLYFAGHGTATDSIDQPRGYLVPADGGKDLDSLLPMEYVAHTLAKLPNKHLLLLLDCCFAGAFRWSGGRDVLIPEPPAMYRERYERFLETPAWQVIASAAHDEQAADVVAGLPIGKRDTDGTHSPFLRALLRGLEGHADVSPRCSDGTVGDGVITATELYVFLREEIEAASSRDRPQTPGMWTLPRHRKGEYIFHVPHARLALPDAPTLSLETSPYRGFLVYEEKHAGLFHGRRAVTETLRQQVEREPITVVIGSSGTGKSSLVRAGLVPGLRNAHPDWQILEPIRPGATPLLTLDAALMRRGSDPAVLIIDQLEELFAAPERAKERNPFLTRLLEATATGSLRIVGTLRADLETEFWSSPLGETWETVRFPLGDMTQAELRDAIEIPAEQKVLTFEPPEMVDRLINTVVSMPGGLPLLSFTLHKLYVDCLRRANNDRKLIELDETGARGIALALREHTDRIYAGFDDATRDTMRRVLLRMVTVKGGTISRRQLPLSELAFADSAECSRVQAVLDALTGRTGDLAAPAASNPDATGYGVRLAVRGGSQDGGFVELAHDAVVRDWPQFRIWLRDASEGDLLLQRAVTASATLWVHEAKHAGYLWRGDPRLPLALSRLAATPHQLNEFEAAFVADSRAAQVQEQEAVLERANLQLNKAKAEAEAAKHGARSRRLAIAVLSIALAALGVGLYLNGSRNQIARADAMEKHGATELADRNFGEAEIAYAESLLFRDNGDVRNSLLRARGGALHVAQGVASPTWQLSAVSSDGAHYAMVRADRIDLGSAQSRTLDWSIPVDPHARVECLAFGSNDAAGIDGRLFAYALDMGISAGRTDVHSVVVARLNRRSDVGGGTVTRLGMIQRATKRISSMAFDRAGAKLAIGSDDGSLGVYSIAGNDTPSEYWFTPNAH